MSPQLTADPIERPPRIAALVIVSALVLAFGSAWLTFVLVRGAVEGGLASELTRTTGLLGSGFPLSDPALAHMAGYLQADLAVLGPDGRVWASNLESESRVALTAAFGRGALPEVGLEAEVAYGQVGEEVYLVGTAPLPGAPRSAGLFVLYPEDLVSARVWAAAWPVAAVLIGSILLAAGLGVLGERAVLRARTKALWRVLGAVAHELRNPLGAIRSLANAASERAPSRSLQLIATESERLELIVEGLREGGRPLVPQPVPLEAFEELEVLLQLVQHRFAHRRVQIEAPEVGGSLRILADPTHVRQVLLNLLENAAEAMPRGGRIRLGSEVSGSRWRLSVQDEGEGVAPDVRRRLFEPFVSTKAKGLGVGLALARGLVRAHGGELWFDDQVEEGARFVLEWPLAPEVPAEVATS